MVAVKYYSFDRLDDGTTAKLVSIIALKQLSNRTSMTIPSFNFQGIWTGKFDSFCTSILFVLWVTR